MVMSQREDNHHRPIKETHASRITLTTMAKQFFQIFILWSHSHILLTILHIYSTSALSPSPSFPREPTKLLKV